MSNAETYFRYLVNEIHTTIVATVDDEDLPVTAAIDMMDCDENSLYLYQQEAGNVKKPNKYLEIWI